jgi:hypothetical protein
LEGTEVADLRRCAVKPKRSSAGKPREWRKTLRVTWCAFCQLRKADGLRADG